MPPKKDSPNFLTRADVDLILEGMTARDIFTAMPGQDSDPSAVKGANVAGAAFEAAAERQGYGALALDRIRPADAVYLASALGEAFQTGGPKGDGTGDSPASPASGG